MTVNVAVVGCGHFGRYHAQKYAALPGCDLVAVVDTNPAAAARVAQEVGSFAVARLDDVIDRIDAASVAVPTRYHHEVATKLLEAGKHVLIEKPLAASREEGRALVELAEARGRLLQVGHLERFNAAILALQDVIKAPLFIESHRLGGFNPGRGTDVSIVLDLMIHDIDLIQEFVGRPLVSVDAVGVAVLTEQDDIANARLQFEGGCTVNVTASRVSMTPQRRMRIFQQDAYIAIDFQTREATIARRGLGKPLPMLPGVGVEERQFDPNDALKLEIESFLKAIRGEGVVAVTGHAGLGALDTALRITEALRRPS
ncbi:MAG: Gfo/Idh/MocA family oxidoreductase [Pseudomonadota bacterium]